MKKISILFLLSITMLNAADQERKRTAAPSAGPMAAQPVTVQQLKARYAELARDPVKNEAEIRTLFKQAERIPNSRVWLLATRHEFNGRLSDAQAKKGLEKKPQQKKLPAYKQRELDKKFVQAVMNNDIKAAQTYLEQGANINVQDEEGDTVLHKIFMDNNKIESLLYYAQKHKLEVAPIIEFLLNNKIDVNVKNNLDLSSWLAFMEYLPETAVYILHEQAQNIVRYLLKAGANIDEQDTEERTALILAYLKGARNIMNFLLEQGADPAIKDVHDHTFLDYIKGDPQSESVMNAFTHKRRMKIQSSTVLPSPLTGIVADYLYYQEPEAKISSAQEEQEEESYGQDEPAPQAPAPIPDTPPGLDEVQAPADMSMTFDAPQAGFEQQEDIPDVE